MGLGQFDAGVNGLNTYNWEFIKIRGQVQQLQYRSDICELRIRVLYAHMRMAVRTYPYGCTHISVWLYTHRYTRIVMRTYAYIYMCKQAFPWVSDVYLLFRTKTSLCISLL